MTLTIIGAGPGGYETAVAAAAKGIEVTIISEGPVGGTCLNEGCIPTKALCRNAEVIEDLRRAKEFGVGPISFSFDFGKAVSRKDEVVEQLRSGVEFLLKGKNIRLLRGRASFADSHTVRVVSGEDEGREVTSDYIIIAAGSCSATLPIPGNDLEGVITSREILSLEAVPERLCVIGAGVIGLEFASIFKSFGSEVTVLEYCKDILPRFDIDLSKRLKQALSKRGISIETSAQVISVSKVGEELSVLYEKKGVEVEVRAGKVLMAVGRRPNVESLNLADAGVVFTRKGIQTDTDFRTSVPHIYAIGDVIGGLMLAHTAVFQGIHALEHILKGGESYKDKIDFSIVPAAVFTYPEAASVGLTEDECKEKGIPVKCLKSFFRANGKAVSMGEPEGFCKLIIEDNADRRLLGCHMFGAHSSDIVQEVSALMNMNARLSDLQRMIHAHPTLSEVLQSAAHSAD